MRITMIGSGNVATHLAAALKNAGHSIVQVYSRNAQHAALLAYHVKAEPIDNLSGISNKTDLFIISVNDDAIETVAASLAAYPIRMVHTSGATPLQVLQQYTDNCGVLYPLQTLSKNNENEVEFRTVPLCIEGANEEIIGELIQFAHTISNRVEVVHSAQRKILHLAAAFACNFTNHLYYTAQQLLNRHDLNFDLLRPLIAETAAKIQHHLPADVQTGPAIRNDEKTMQAHLALLEKDENLKMLYKLFSQAIIKMGEAKHTLK